MCVRSLLPLLLIGTVYSQSTITTDDGKIIILYDDGTWQFVTKCLATVTTGIPK